LSAGNPDRTPPLSNRPNRLADSGGDDGGGKGSVAGQLLVSDMALTLSPSEARQVVCAAFEGRRPEDEILEIALKLCNITREKFVYLKGEMRSANVGRDRFAVLTPTGGQRRRR